MASSSGIGMEAKVIMREITCFWLTAALMGGLLFGIGVATFGFGWEEEEAPKGKLSAELRAFLEQMPPGEPAVVWVIFKDRGIGSPGELERSLREREARFSPRVLQRRAKVMGERRVLPGDLPVNQEYVARVLSTGCRLRYRSSWINAISVEATAEMIEQVAALAFVERIQRVATMGGIHPMDSRGPEKGKGGETTLAGGLDYGPSLEQLELINVPAIHDSGYSGDGVIVLMLDTGYYQDHEALITRDVIAEWDFVFNDGETQNEPEDVSGQHDHGTATWSTLGGFFSGELIGPAYNASFLLAKTEDLRSETPAEEDYYVAALEWADTLGADIASASLAYRDFDDPYPDYAYSDLDGNTAVISIAVDEAARRGILVCNAIGNWGPGSGSLWTPSDADSMLACGAVDPSGFLSDFSSRGPTYDGRLKPEVLAQGESVYAASSGGGYYYTGGTSLSTPLVGGSAALVLEAHPDWGPMEVREALMATASRATFPDSDWGSGLIDVWRAIYEEGVELTPTPFSLIQPSPEDTVWITGIDFSWTASADPIGRDVSYKLMVSTDSLFDDPLVAWDIPENAYSLTDTLMQGDYYWKVFAYNNQGFYRESDEIFRFYAQELTGTGGEGSAPLPPRSFALNQNHPNPFNPSTTISFDIPPGVADGDDAGGSRVRLNAYDLRGRHVGTLFDGALPGGHYQISWDGRGDAGQILPSGVYIYRLVSEGKILSRKMVLSK